MSRASPRARASSRPTRALLKYGMSSNSQYCSTSGTSAGTSSAVTGRISALMSCTLREFALPCSAQELTHVLRTRAPELDAQAHDLPAPAQLDVGVGLKPDHAVAVFLVQEDVQRAALQGRRRVDAPADAERGETVVRGFRRTVQVHCQAANFGQGHFRMASAIM